MYLSCIVSDSERTYKQNKMDTLARIVICSVLCQIGLGLQFINPDESDSETFFTREVNVGDVLELKCRTLYASGENTGTNPSKWHKTQKEEEKANPEGGIEISNLGLKSESFREIDRVSVSFVLEKLTETDLNLNIEDVQKEDSGYYFCFSVKDGTPLYITYHVTVKTNHNLVTLSNPAESANNSQSNILIYRVGEPASVKCEANGGYPDATLKLYIEGDDTPLTGVASTTYEYEGDNVGLQQIRAKSSLLAEPLVMHPEQDGSEIICEIVSQENMLRDSKVLSIFFGPRNIQCDEDVKAREGDRVVFRCKFSANPAPEALTWTVRDRDDLITVETDGQEVDGQYTASLNLLDEKTSTGQSLFETTFTIMNVKDSHYHGYDVEIQNDGFPAITKNFVLKRGENTINTGPVGGATYTSLSCALLLSTLAAIFWTHHQ